MPTAFTAGIIDEDEYTFKDFALACTRNFVFDIREIPLKDELPETIDPELGYYEEALAKAEAQLAEAEGWDADVAQHAADEDHTEEVEAEHKAVARAAAAREKLEAILIEAKSWKPPTEMHERFKEFMVEQIKGTLDFEGTHTSYRNLQARTGEQYKLARIQQATDAIQRHKDDIEKAKKRAKEATDWLDAVRKSLA